MCISRFFLGFPDNFQVYLISFFVLISSSQDFFCQTLTLEKDTIIRVCDTNDITISKDIFYGDKGSENSNQFLDLYLPKNNSNKLSVLVFIHGGGFKGGDKNPMKIIAEKIAARGIAVININYTLGLKNNDNPIASCASNMSGGIPERFHPELKKSLELASNDVLKALSWIKNYKRKYQFDISRVSVSGGSAGAMTALYTAYDIKKTPVKIYKVINLWGGMENTDCIKRNSPPLLTYHGDEDKTINIEFAYALNNKMEKLNKSSSKLIVLKGKGHAQYRLIASQKIQEIVQFLKTPIKS